VDTTLCANIVVGEDFMKSPPNTVPCEMTVECACLIAREVCTGLRFYFSIFQDLFIELNEVGDYTEPIQALGSMCNL
jgi:hypothetical protein